jgi:hypothetical protein
MKKYVSLVAGMVLLALVPGVSGAQTCSCAGVPILGAMESASPKDSQWYLAGTYEYHDISELVSGSSTVHDGTGRDRTAQAMILEASRGLSEKWSFSALLSAIEHERDVGGQRDTVNGVGDAIVMLKYSPKTISLYEKTTVSFGLGTRLAIGEDDAKSQGVVLAEDLQPSTGAYGGILWVYAARALNDSRGARIYASATHTYNGENDRDYQFGQSTTASIGGSYQTQTPWGFNLELLYRHADRDQRASADIPNTGGAWLDIIPAVQYHVNESLAVRASAKIPVSRDLNDQLQFTSKYAFRLSLSYVFGGNN